MCGVMNVGADGPSRTCGSRPATACSRAPGSEPASGTGAAGPAPNRARLPPTVREIYRPGSRAPVDKYLLVVLVFLIAGMGIAITKSPPVLPLFYAMLAGAVGVIMYSAWRARIEARRERERKRRR